MDISTGKAMHMTSILIPMEIRKEIKAQNMTVSGAFLAGWQAIKERKEANVELQEVRNNMSKYRDGYMRLKARVDELEGLK